MLPPNSIDTRSMSKRDIDLMEDELAIDARIALLRDGQEAYGVIIDGNRFLLIPTEVGYQVTRQDAKTGHAAEWYCMGFFSAIAHIVRWDDLTGSLR